MPGISFVCDLKGHLMKKKSIILHSLDSLIHTGQYEREILLNEKSYLLGCTRYKEYPITSFENDEFCIYLEGQIYGKDYSSINRELNNLAEHIFRTQIRAKEQVTEWLLNTDGDFIVFILNKKSGEIAIINDALCRLPLYYYKANGELIVSRELRFVASLINDKRFDRMAIAQYLIFGYPLGKRTLLENIYQLGPATLIRINIDKSEIILDTLYHFNFETKKHNNRNIEQNASELISLFSKACKNRTLLNNKNILSLSGGFDSRSIAICLHNNNNPFFGVTFLDFNKNVSLDVKFAEQIANTFNIDWKLFQLGPPTGKDVLELLKIKNGLNPLGMSYILPFFHKIKETYGSRVTYFTGDGGDKTLRDISPPKKLKSLDKLVNHILSTRNIFLLNDVVALTQIKKSEIIEELKNHILSYPEEEWDQKYVHFLIYEKVFKWHLEGEDRNRFYFWSAAPFYSIPFFRYAMNCPDSQKSQFALYRHFLLKLSPKAASINHAEVTLTLSIKGKIKDFIIGILYQYPNLKKKVRKRDAHKESYDHNSNIMNCLGEQMNNCKSIREYLSYTVIEGIVKNCSKYAEQDIENLFTLTSSIEELECNGSTIEKYYESDFI